MPISKRVLVHLPPIWNGAAFSPADSTTYYVAINGAAPNTTIQDARPIVPFPCVIRHASIVVNVAGTLGTTEAVTVGIRVLNTTNYVLSSAVVFDATRRTYDVDGLNIPLASGDDYAGYITTPAWVTNPTNPLIWITLYVEP